MAAGPWDRQRAQSAAPPSEAGYQQNRGTPWAVPQAIAPGPHNGPGGMSLLRQTGSATPSAPGAQPIIDPTRFPTVIDNVVSVGQQSVQFLDSPAGKRIILGLRNSSPVGGANIFIGFGAAATTNSWLQLLAATAAAPGTIVLFDESVPQNQLFAIADAANGRLSFIYSDINM